jgi:hypothetical protein
MHGDRSTDGGHLDVEEMYIVRVCLSITDGILAWDLCITIR